MIFFPPIFVRDEIWRKIAIKQQNQSNFHQKNQKIKIKSQNFVQVDQNRWGLRLVSYQRLWLNSQFIQNCMFKVSNWFWGLGFKGFRVFPGAKYLQWFASSTTMEPYLTMQNVPITLQKTLQQVIASVPYGMPLHLKHTDCVLRLNRTTFW